MQGQYVTPTNLIQLFMRSKDALIPILLLAALAAANLVVHSPMARAGTYDYIAPEVARPGRAGNTASFGPWHGYRFDLRTDESADGRGYRLVTAPRVAVDPVTGDARLVRCSRPRSGRNTVNRPSSGRKAQT